MSTLYYRGKALVYGVDDSGLHVVPDGHWMDYLLLREEQPRVVRCVDRVSDVLAALGYGDARPSEVVLRAKVVRVDRVTPAGRLMLDEVYQGLQVHRRTR